MAQRSRVRGDVGFRKILRQLPDAAREEMADVMAGIGVAVVREIEADTPFRKGALRRGVTYRLARRTLRLRIGLVGPARQRRDLFYGRILNFGRKAQTVTIRNGKRAGQRMRIGAIKPMNFVTKRRPELRRRIGDQLRGYWDNVLTAAAAGASFDD